MNEKQIRETVGDASISYSHKLHDDFDLTDETFRHDIGRAIDGAFEHVLEKLLSSQPTTPETVRGGLHNSIQEQIDKYLIALDDEDDEDARIELQYRQDEARRILKLVDTYSQPVPDEQSYTDYHNQPPVPDVAGLREVLVSAVLLADGTNYEFHDEEAPEWHGVVLNAIDDLFLALPATQPGITAERVKELEKEFGHYHVSRMDGTDICAECNFDLRDTIHFRAELTPTTEGE